MLASKSFTRTPKPWTRSSAGVSLAEGPHRRSPWESWPSRVIPAGCCYSRHLLHLILALISAPRSIEERTTATVWSYHVDAHLGEVVGLAGPSRLLHLLRSSMLLIRQVQNHIGVLN